MTTLTQLKKRAIEYGFVEKMSRLGFTLGPDRFWFYRERGEYIDVIDFWVKSSKEWVDVPVTCYPIELVDHCDMSQFPKGFIKNARNLGGHGLSEDGVDLGRAWEIGDDKTIRKSFTALYESIEKHANSWFKKIKSRETFFDSLYLHSQEVMHKKGLFLDLPLHDIQ